MDPNEYFRPVPTFSSDYVRELLDLYLKMERRMEGRDESRDSEGGT